MNVNTLIDALARLPLDDVRSIVASRHGILDLRLQQNTQYSELLKRVANGLMSQDCTLSATADISLADTFVLGRLVQEGANVNIEAILAGVIPEDRDSVWASLRRLTRSGLAITVQSASGWLCIVPPSSIVYSGLPPSFSMSLAAILPQSKPDVLKRMVEALGLGAFPARDDAIRTICSCLGNEQRVNELVDGLSLIANRLFLDALQRGGCISLIQASSHLESRHRSQVFVYDWFRTWWKSHPRNPLEELLSIGLLVASDNIGYGYGLFIVPREIGKYFLHVNYLEDRAMSKPGPRVCESSVVAPLPPVSTRRDLAIVMSQVRLQRPMLTSKGAVHRNFLKACARLIAIPDLAYATYLYVIAQWCLLWSTEGDTLTPSIWWSEFTRIPIDEAVRCLSVFWVNQAIWLEDVDNYLGAVQYLLQADNVTNWRLMIRTTLREMTEEVSGEWLDLESVCERVRFHRPALLSVVQSNAELIALFRKDYPAVTFSDPEILLRAPLVLRVIQSLRFLGLAEVGVTRNGLQIAVRAKSQETGQEQDQIRQKFTVQPNHEIFAASDLPMDILYNLGCIADPISANHFRLTAESVRRALDVGFELTEIKEFLMKGASNQLPQSVSMFLSEIEGNYGRIRVGAAVVYIVCDTPDLLQELAMNNRKGFRLVDTPSPTVAIVDTPNIDTTLKLLRKAGYAPTERFGRVSHRDIAANPMGLLQNTPSIKSRNQSSGDAPFWVDGVPPDVERIEHTGNWVPRIHWERFEEEITRAQSK